MKKGGFLSIAIKEKKGLLQVCWLQYLWMGAFPKTSADYGGKKQEPCDCEWSFLLRAVPVCSSDWFD